MIVYHRIVLALWTVFILYWIFSAIGVKKSVKGGRWWRGAGLRVLVIATILLALRLQFFRALVIDSEREVAASSALLAPAGTAVCILGLASAVWARVHLGRNWGQPMSLKEGHELITTGPYAFVRHPIYTGILVAMFGSLLVEGALWLILLAVSGVYFIYSATVEDTLMSHEFPNLYPDYKRRTKMLIPFLL
jgi:protein-S-isoprenylcysteine O-methyltransferase Ste14